MFSQSDQQRSMALGCNRVRLPLPCHFLGPVDELQCFFYFCRIWLSFVNQNKCCSSNWPACFTWLVSRHNSKAWCFVPCSAGCSRFERISIWCNKLTFAVFQLSVRQIVFLCICKFNIADRAVDTLNVSSNTFVTFTAQACWPFDGCAGANDLFELCIDFRQVVREQESSTRCIRAVNDSDIFRW